MKGCLLLHGYTGGPFEVASLAKVLENQGFLISCPTLHGHHNPKQDLRHSTYRDWLQSAEEAYFQLANQCDEIAILGFSMGGLLTFHLATKYKVKCIVSMSTPIFCIDMKNLLSDIFYGFKLRDIEKIKNYLWTVTVPFKANLNFQKMLYQSRSLVKQIDTPIFIAQGKKDPLVKFKSAQFIYDHVKTTSKEINFYEKSDHRLHSCEERERIFEDIQRFILAYL